MQRVDYAARHRLMVAMGNAVVAAGRDAANQDPLRPVFHILPVSRHCGDPNGPVHVNGAYHLFFQHAPFLNHGRPLEIAGLGPDDAKGTGWGHVSSVDLAHWRREPVALMYVPGEYNDRCCASGSVTLDAHGTATAIYTSVSPKGEQTQSIAVAQDPDLRIWSMYDGNPVVPKPPEIPGFRGGFRDPFVWREGGSWYLLVGAGVAAGGALLLYRSDDLRRWDYLSMVGPGMGPHCQMWECPNMLCFADQCVLVVSPLVDNDENLRRRVHYTVAPYGGPTRLGVGTEFRTIDFGNQNDFYATQCLQAPDGRHLLWGMVLGGGSPQHPWWGQLSLPRVLTLRPDNRLGMAPPAELELLRGAHWGIEDAALDRVRDLPVRGSAIELLVLLDPGQADMVAVDVRGSDDFSQRVRVCVDFRSRRIAINDFGTDFELFDDEPLLRLHLFIDRSVVEAFVNDRECGTATARHDVAHDRIRLLCEGGPARIRSLDLWEMKPAF